MVNIGQPRDRDIVLRIAALAETITVSAELPIIPVSSSAVGQVVAWASAAARCSGVGLAGSGGVQSDCGCGVVLVSGPPPPASASNCDLRARE